VVDHGGFSECWVEFLTYSGEAEGVEDLREVRPANRRRSGLLMPHFPYHTMHRKGY